MPWLNMNIYVLGHPLESCAMNLTRDGLSVIWPSAVCHFV